MFLPNCGKKRLAVEPHVLGGLDEKSRQAKIRTSGKRKKFHSVTLVTSFPPLTRDIDFLGLHTDVVGVLRYVGCDLIGIINLCSVRHIEVIVGSKECSSCQCHLQCQCYCWPLLLGG